MPVLHPLGSTETEFEMDQMLSPGFSIPSIGTPLHQPEEDQQILPLNSPLPQRQQTSSGFGLNLPHQQQNHAPTSSQALYNMPGFTPQHMLQPQTPVNILTFDIFIFISLVV